MGVPDLRSPYPWMGGKSTIASTVWRRFGSVQNYVEPFFGSGAVLLDRPQPFEGLETVNDLNGWLCNFWRALQADPDAVAHYADWPVSECDLSARGDWLFYRAGVTEFIERLRADPEYYDAKSAGWWVWGQCCWIGGGWGQRGNGKRMHRKPPHLNAGMGVNRQPPYLKTGQGVHHQRPNLGDAGRGVNRQGRQLSQYLYGLAERMRRVRVCCGDWQRICGPTPTVKLGLTAVFLDPPYGVANRTDCYGAEEDYEVSKLVRAWAVEHSEDKLLRIALCGYDGEHIMPPTWKCVAWKAHGGYGSQAADGENDNAERERIWFSPHCLGDTVQGDLFDPDCELNSELSVASDTLTIVCVSDSKTSGGSSAATAKTA